MGTDAHAIKPQHNDKQQLNNNHCATNKMADEWLESSDGEGGMSEGEDVGKHGSVVKYYSSLQ